MGISAIAPSTQVVQARTVVAPLDKHDQGPTWLGVGIGAGIGVLAGPGLGYLQLTSTGSVPSSPGGKAATAAALAVAGAMMFGLGGGIVTDIGRASFGGSGRS